MSKGQIAVCDICPILKPALYKYHFIIIVIIIILHSGLFDIFCNQVSGIQPIFVGFLPHFLNAI